MNLTGANSLLCLLYETEKQDVQEGPQLLHNVPRVWRFRTPISLEHMRHSFETRDVKTPAQKQQLAVLQLFLKEVCLVDLLLTMVCEVRTVTYLLFTV